MVAVARVRRPTRLVTMASVGSRRKPRRERDVAISSRDDRRKVRIDASSLDLRSALHTFAPSTSLGTQSSVLWSG